METSSSQTGASAAAPTAAPWGRGASSRRRTAREGACGPGTSAAAEGSAWRCPGDTFLSASRPSRKKEREELKEYFHFIVLSLIFFLILFLSPSLSSPRSKQQQRSFISIVYIPPTTVKPVFISKQKEREKEKEKRQENGCLAANPFLFRLALSVSLLLSLIALSLPLSCPIPPPPSPALL